MVSWKLPEATSDPQVFTAWPENVASMPAAFSTASAWAGCAVAELVSDVTGAPQAANVGRVRPVALSTGFSRLASPSVAISDRLMARLIALRTGSWLVGHLFRFGIRLLVPPGASQ